MSTFAFPLFKNTTPDGPAFLAGICEDGKMMAVTFSGSDPGAVVASARSFADRNLDTPDRRARLAARAEAAKARRTGKAAVDAGAAKPLPTNSTDEGVAP